jgi:gliding motility-associated-like protein
MHKHPVYLKTFWTAVGLILTGYIIAQPVNDNCLSATHIPTALDYCSEKGEFTIVGATPSSQEPVPCFPSSTTDVWFTFFAATPAAAVQVNGADAGNSGTLEQPSLAILQGNCTSGFTQVACGSDAVSSQNVELIFSDLIIGELYYIRVDARNGNTGTFQICINSFIPANEPSADCPTAGILCDKSPFVIEQLLGAGLIKNEAAGSCLEVIPGDSESSSVWYTWTCDIAGSLTFTLTPTSENITEDLDFAVYELPNGINNCSGKILLRCMASGENGGEPFSQWQRCTGPTGLRVGETDIVEFAGCQPGDNNFIAPIDMEAGKSYALVVNNFTRSGRGFEVEWGGTGTFLGPEVDFEIEAVQAFECDKTITFLNLSNSATDSIVSYKWNFGAGGVPVSASGTGPHDVIYESFGDKRAALTIETSRGCLVTKIIDLYVEPCCADTSTLAVGANTVDLLCPDVPTGVIQAFGISGAPVYQYSLDGGNFQPSSVYPGLGPGIYMLTIIDEKGCMDEIDVEIFNAPPYTVDAGDTLFTDLGFPVQINAIVSPNIFSKIVWTPLAGLVFDSDSLNPVAVAPGSTLYNIEVTNPAGCVATDDVFVLVNTVRPVYIPNVFSPNGDGINDLFFVSANPAVSEIEKFSVYNRWGAVVYEQNSTTYGIDGGGWDGRFRGQYAQIGVYAYHARIRFIDGFVADYSGSVTVLR